MMYYARFESIDGRLFRFDTRVYLDAESPDEPSQCIGAIIGKNPGSASPRDLGKLAPLDLANDKMLPYVRNRFRAAYAALGRPVPRNSFLRVWNLFYLCNADLGEATRALAGIDNPPTCPTEGEAPPLTWFAWGGDDRRLNAFKARFCQDGIVQPFFVHGKTRRIMEVLPDESSPAKHPQGMAKEPVERYLAKVLRCVRLDC